MKRIYIACRELLQILFSQKPFLVILTFVSAILSGLTTPLLIWVNSRIFDLGLLTAQGEITFLSYLPYLALFVLLSLLPYLWGTSYPTAISVPGVSLFSAPRIRGKCSKAESPSL